MLPLKVARIETATSHTKQIELVATDGGSLPPFTAGAHLDLELGNGEARSYSLLNDPAERNRYVIAVLREEGGRGGSRWIHDELKVGDILASPAPINHFPLSEDGEHHILIAGGIGITPIASMASRLASLGKTYEIHYCTRSRADTAFADELATRHGDRITFIHDGGDPARGLDVAALLAKRPAAGHAYVCGPAGLIRAVREAGRDWPKGTVHYELFKGSEDDTAPRKTDQAFDVVLQKSGRTLRVPADETILAVLKKNGFKIKTLCTEGVCGTCRVKLVSGTADHRAEVLTDDEHDIAIQVCVSRAMPGETLVLDL